MMKSVILRGVVVILMFFIGAVIGYNILYQEEVLRVFKPSDINSDLVDDSLKYSMEDHKIGMYSLLNQDGKVIIPAEFDGTIYVANFIFTTCPGICPIMTNNMEQVYQEYYDEKQFKIISHTVQPEIDSVPVLKEYAEKHYAAAPKWHFVTGEKSEIYNLARKHYFAAIDEGDGGIDDFVHTENFILIDKEKRIRGYYDGTDQEEVDRLIHEIEVLLKEYEK